MKFFNVHSLFVAYLQPPEKSIQFPFFFAPSAPPPPRFPARSCYSTAEVLLLGDPDFPDRNLYFRLCTVFLNGYTSDVITFPPLCRRQTVLYSAFYINSVLRLPVTLRP